MPAFGYLELTGTIQGQIVGGATRSLRNGLIEVQQFNHNVVMSKGKSVGLPLGIRAHKPLSIVKSIDESTPKIIQMLCTEERITTAIFSWYGPDESGEQALFYQIRLENAFISSVQGNMPTLNEDNWENHKMVETVSFIYERISWSWGADGSIEFEDEWV